MTPCAQKCPPCKCSSLAEAVCARNLCHHKDWSPARLEHPLPNEAAWTWPFDALQYKKSPPPPYYDSFIAMRLSSYTLALTHRLSGPLLGGARSCRGWKAHSQDASRQTAETHRELSDSPVEKLGIESAYRCRRPSDPEGYGMSMPLFAWKSCIRSVRRSQRRFAERLRH